MNKKTRAVAILLVAVMILSLVASMVIPYCKIQRDSAEHCFPRERGRGSGVRAAAPKGVFSFRREYPL